MNFDDLKNQWAEQNSKLDRVMRMNVRAVQQARIGRTRSGLKWMLPGLLLELVLAVIAVVWLGGFIAGHVSELKFLLPAVVLDVCAIALLGACIRQLTMLAALDYDGPIVGLQKGLGQLRILRIRTSKWSMTLAFVLWFPLLIVVFEGLIGVDPWIILGAIQDRGASAFAWIVANLVFGLAVVAAVTWFSHRYSGRFAHSPFMKRLMDDFAGRSLTKAQHALDEIARFETDLVER